MLYFLSRVNKCGSNRQKRKIADFLAITGADKGAPGVNIYSTGIDGRYVEMDGTSITTPHEVGKEIY